VLSSVENHAKNTGLNKAQLQEGQKKALRHKPFGAFNGLGIANIKACQDAALRFQSNNMAWGYLSIVIPFDG